MSHFRLRRQVRLVVDHLSLQSIGPSKWPMVAYPIAILFSTLPAAPGPLLSGVFPQPADGSSALPAQPSQSFSWRLFWRGLLHRWRRIPRRRHVAMIVISIAIAVEVCGCDLARHAGALFDPPVSGAAMPAALLGRHMLSFYDPIQTGTELSASSTGDDLRLLSRSLLNDAKPSPWAIPESVYFVYRSGLTGSGGFGRQPLATAFVLSVPDRKQHGVVRMLVTARHVVDPRWARCSETNPLTIDLRLNRRAGGVGYETVSLQSQGHRRFFTPADPTADIAVMLLDQNAIPNIEEYKFIDVPFRMLPTDSEIRQFRTSQPVITARAAVRPISESGNFPVFDGGVLAKMSSEAVNVQCGSAPEIHPQDKSLHLWMISAGAPEGVSGAPVYTAVARTGGTQKTAVLLGVQSVAWTDESVAGITPSSVLGDLVQTTLREKRLALDFYKGPELIPKETSASLY